MQNIIIYTDGSCNTQTLLGGWAAIVMAGNEKTLLKGQATETTHNRMELTAVIKAIEFAAKKYDTTAIDIYTDSQYVARLTERKEKLKTNNFITKKGNELPNADLLQLLIKQIETFQLSFYKVKAHQKNDGSENLNREVDMICRKIVRDASPGSDF